MDLVVQDVRIGGKPVVMNVHHLVEALADELVDGELGDALRDRVHVGDLVRGVHDEDRVPDAVQDGEEPELALLETVFHFVPEDSELDGRFQLFLVDRLDDVSRRVRGEGPLQRGAVGRRGDEDDRYAVYVVDLAGRVNTVELPAEDDVHQHHVGVYLDYLVERFFAGRHGLDDAVSQVADKFSEQQYGCLVVFNQENLMAHRTYLT